MLSAGLQIGKISYLKRSLTAASLAPMYLFSTSGPFTPTKRMPAAATAAETTWVLPQPGGPYSSTPVRNLKGALHMQHTQLQHNRKPAI